MMTCAIPKHPADPAGERCGAHAVTVRIIFGGPPAPVCEAHATKIDRLRGHGMTAAERAHLDAAEGRPVKHRDDIRGALVDLRVAADDGDAITEDMLRPPRERELGPVLHARNYREARSKLLAAFAFLMRELTDDDGEPGDPSGNGGAGPTH